MKISNGMKTILQKEEKILRMVAKEVPIKDIKSLKIRRVLKEMSMSLKSQSDGVALAAPQIGHSLRIFIVAGKIFEKSFGKNKIEQEEGSEGKKKKAKDVIFINPKISKLSKNKDWIPEGCLSVRPFYGQTLRSKKTTIEAYDERGLKFTRGASGLLAQIFQHETDHLNGILFIDHAKNVKAEKPPNESR